MVVFFQAAGTPSGLSPSRCRCGITVSSTSKKPIPSIKPINAGSQAGFPCASAISMDGIKRDHTEAAIITPEAKPSNNFLTRLPSPFFNKKTIAAPNAVPAKGMVRIIHSVMRFLSFLYTRSGWLYAPYPPG